MKIEPGCRAVIVNSRGGNDGKIVRVIKLLPYKSTSLYPPIHNQPMWQVSETLIGYSGKPTNAGPESQLQRLPDDEQLSSWAQVEKVTKWNPMRELA